MLQEYFHNDIRDVSHGNEYLDNIIRKKEAKENPSWSQRKS